MQELLNLSYLVVSPQDDDPSHQEESSAHAQQRIEDVKVYHLGQYHEHTYRYEVLDVVAVLVPEEQTDLKGVGEAKPC